MPKTYDPQTYWEQRLTTQLNVTTVGHSGLGYVYNAWLYHRRFQVMKRLLPRLMLNLNDANIVEFGVGSGLWVQFWQEQQIQKLIGIDITQASVNTLSQKFPSYQFWQGDIGSPHLLLPDRQYDIVTAFDVLFHLTDDEMFFQAIQHLGSLVKQDGVVLISDSFCPEPWGPYFHEYHRSYQQYETALKQAGLNIVHIEPIFFLMTTTLCQNSWVGKLLRFIVKINTFVVRRLARYPYLEPLNHLIGGALYLLDSVIAPFMRSGPSLKFLVAQRF